MTVAREYKLEKTPYPSQQPPVSHDGGGDRHPPEPHSGGDGTARGYWTSQWDFFLSIVGYAVGLGNMWRFPYLCYRNGGGAFLLPYCIMLLLTGLPMIGLEMCIGQYASLGPAALFEQLSPVFSGVGYGIVTISFFIVCYYNLIMAWTVFYTAASLRSVLGWSNCANHYNTVNCYTPAEEAACRNSSSHSMFWNQTCYPVASFCRLHDFSLLNATHCVSLRDPSVVKPYGQVGNRISATEDFFSNYMLGLRDHTWADYGQLKWDLCLCLLAAWLVVALCLIKGVKSSGKVVYFTALFPYVVLVILFARGVTLDGAMDGMRYYLTPNFSRLADSHVWSDAATQIFFSFGIGFGGIITLASYNRFTNNCIRDAILVGLINCGTSIFAGSVVFCVLGFMAKRLGTEVSEVVTSGPGLTFIVYPEAVVHLPISPLWAVLFFGMVLTLGLDSQFAMVETVLTAVYDRWPQTRRKKAIVSCVASAIGFAISLSMCTGGGIHLFTLLDWYSSSWSLLLLALLELLLVGWVFGAERMLHRVQHQMGIHMPTALRSYWYCTWKFVTPVTLSGLLVFSVVQYVPAFYHTYVYPDAVNAMGWLIALLPGTLVPLTGIIRYCRRDAGQSLVDLLRATARWGPPATHNSDGAPAHAPVLHAHNLAETYTPLHKEWSIALSPTRTEHVDLSPITSVTFPSEEARNKVEGVTAADCDGEANSLSAAERRNRATVKTETSAFDNLGFQADAE